MTTTGERPAPTPDDGSASTPGGRGLDAWLPTPAELTGVGARALLQLWDLALAWWKLAPETGFAETVALLSTSKSVKFTRRPDRVVYLKWSAQTLRGVSIPAARIHVTPTQVDPGPADDHARLRVEVERPAGDSELFYRLTICDRDDPSFACQYSFGMGVPYGPV